MLKSMYALAISAGLLFFALAACPPPDVPDTSPSSPTPTDTPPTEVPTPTPTPTPRPDPCNAVDVTANIDSANYLGDTTGAPDSFTTPCVGTGGADELLAFVAPSSAAYTVSTAEPASVFDTGLWAFSDCQDPGGTSLGCSDDADFVNDVFQSRITIGADAGARVYLVVDGWGAGDLGAFELSIKTQDCSGAADANASVNAANHTGDTTAASNDWELGCGDPGGSEDLLSFNAPSTGTWTISLDHPGTAFDTVLSAFIGCAPFGPSFVCDDNTGSGTTSVLSIDAQAGDLVYLLVEGFESGEDGSYELSITGP